MPTNVSQKGYINFFELIKNPDSNKFWDKLLSTYSTAFPYLVKDFITTVDKLNLRLQTDQYKQQICIYICFIEKILEIDTSCKYLLGLPIRFKIKFDDENNHHDDYNVTFTYGPFNPIQISQDLDTTISMSKVNCYISMLIETESYFFDLLTVLYISILSNDKNNIPFQIQ